MAGNIKLTSVGSSGTTTLQSNETADRILDLPDKTDRIITRTLEAGTNTQAPLIYTSGTVLSTPAAGATEFDGTVFYSTPVASARGLSPSVMFSIVPAADFTLLTTSGVQSAFPTTGDVWTLAAATTYFFEGQYLITHTTTTCTVAMAFACSNAPTSIDYFAVALQSVANTTVSTATAAVGNLTWVNQVATTVVTGTSTAGWAIRFRGILRTNLSTTVTPQVNWSANTTAAIMKQNSYITFTPTGTSTANVLGNVA